MKRWMKDNRIWFLLLGLFALPLNLYSNSEYIVSVMDGQTPYRIVVKDDSDMCKDLPGIYGRDSSGAWRQILSGNVIGGRTTVGVLAELRLTKKDGRLQIMALMDGAIHIFHLNTTIDNPQSFICLGSPQTPVFDLFFPKKSVQLPKLTSSDDVSIAQGNPEHGKQVVLVSIKLPHLTLSGGNGMTILLSIESAKDSSSTEIKLSRPPVIIDYQFRARGELRRLMFDNGILSTMFLEHHLQSIDEKAPHALQVWRDQMEQILARVNQGQEYDGSMAVPPLIDDSTGQILKGDLPTDEEIIVSNSILAQIYDPIGGQDGIHIRAVGSIPPPHVSPLDYTIWGKLDVDSSGIYRILSGDVLNDGLSSGAVVATQSLAYINGELYYFAEFSNKVGWIKLLDYTKDRIKNVAYYVCAVVENKRVFHYVLASAQFETSSGIQNQTLVWVLEREGDNSQMKMVRFISVNNILYHIHELTARTFLTPEGIFFDHVTPSQISLDAYRQVYDPTGPHINLSRSSPNNFQIGYLKAQEEVDVVPHGVQFRQFNEKGRIPTETGLYIGQDPTETKKIVGELLIPAWGTRDNPALFFKQVHIDEFHAEVHIIALDSTFCNGESGFSVVIYVHPVGVSSLPPPFFMTFVFRFPFSRLKNVVLFSGKNKKSSSSTLFLSIEPKVGDRADAVRGVLATTLQIAKEEKKESEKKESEKKESEKKQSEKKQTWVIKQTMSERILTPEGIPPSELMVRLMSDSEGNLYWVVDPKKRKSDRDFMVMRLTDGASIVADAMHPSANLVNLSEEDSADSFGGRYTWGTWQLYSKYSVEKLLAVFEAADLGAQKLDEKKGIKSEKWVAVRQRSVHSRMREVFPGLIPMLDRLSDPSLPPEHKVVLVPEENVDLLMGYLFRAWTDEKVSQQSQKHFPPSCKWDVDNPDLKVSMWRPEHAGQDDLFSNLDDMAARSPTKRAVLVVKMDNLAAAPRPTHRLEKDKPLFTISETPSPESGSSAPQELPPHSLYLLATEGQRMSLGDFAKMSPEEIEKKVSIVVIGSRNKWHAIMKDVASGPEGRAGLANHFTKVVSYYHGTWRVWGPNSSTPNPIVHQWVASEQIGKYRDEVFQDLETILRESADPSQPPRHRVLIVSPEIREFVRLTIFTRWADSTVTGHPWNFQNPALRLFHMVSVDGKITQEQVLENLTIMRSLEKGQRPVLMAGLDAVKTLNRPPVGGDGGFQLQDVDASVAKDGDATLATDAEEVTFPPHILYLLATEGEKVDLRNFRNLGHPRVPMLLFGTEQEWRRVLEDMTFERRVDIAAHFETVTLTAPNDTTRKKMLATILSRPDVRGLNYTFDSRIPGAAVGEPIDQKKAEDQILAYMVNACERAAKDNGIDPLMAFLRFYRAFSRAVVGDEVVRRRRCIDRMMVQRILAQIFRVQLNPALLPPDDPLVILQSDDFHVRMQNAGAEGLLDPRIAKVLLKQTEPTPKLAIPSSFILFGESSSGKTRLVLALIRALGLTLYDFNKPLELDAGAFVLNCRKLVDGTEEDDSNAVSTDGSMTVGQAFRHLDHFLTLPNGARGFIFLDDVHAPADKVRAKLIAKIQTLVGAEDGMFRGKSALFAPDKSVVEVPLRNMTFVVVANPVYNQKRLQEYVPEKDRWKDPTVEQLLLASLTTDEFKLEPSFLLRFSAVIPMDTFSMGARVPAVLNDTRKGAQQIFSTQGKLIVVSPEAAQWMSDRFGENARTLLSRAPQALLSRVDTSMQSPLYVVIPKGNVLEEGDARLHHERQYDEREIENFARQYTEAIPVGRGQYEGELELLKYLVSGFRVQVVEALIKFITRDRMFIGNPLVQNGLLAPLLHATKAHLELNKGIRLEEMVLNPKDFGATNPALEKEFEKALHVRDTVERGFFPRWIFEPTRNQDLLPFTLGEKRFMVSQVSRRDVMVRRVMDGEKHLKIFLARYFGLDSLDRHPDVAEWLKGIKSVSAEHIGAIGEELGRVFLDFISDIHRGHLVEVQATGKFKTVTPYDASRLYFLVLDRAISKLPWGFVTPFVTSALELASRDVSLGEKPQLQMVLFEDRTSFLAPRTPELPIQMVVNASAFKEWRDEPENTAKEERFSKRFLDECEAMFARPE